MDSILTSIKKLFGIDAEYTHFDNDLIMHINSVFMILAQLGVGPSEGYSITSADDIWSDFLGEDLGKLESVKTYVYLKTRLMFDPPTGSALIESINRQVSELEWRLHVAVDPVETE